MMVVMDAVVLVKKTIAEEAALERKRLQYGVWSSSRCLGHAWDILIKLMKLMVAEQRGTTNAKQGRRYPHPT